MISAEKENSISISENKRLLRSDHGTTYFSISDNLNEFDGLWSYGFHLFQRVFINEKERVVGKKISRFQCEMTQDFTIPANITCTSRLVTASS